MKSALLTISLMFVNSQVFAVETCPQVLRLSSLEIIATLEENQTFEMKGDTWTLTYSSGDWRSLLNEESTIGDNLRSSRIILKKDKEILHCDYEIWRIREDKYHGIHKKIGEIFIETTIKD